MSSTDLVQTPASAATLFAGATPGEVLAAASDAADALSDMIRKQHLYQQIGQRDHVLVEGWQACGTLAGVFAVKDGGVREIPWPEHVEQSLQDVRDRGLCYGFTAAYRAVKDEREVGWGEGRCTRAERNWRTRDDYALSSMAQTRGQSRALRQPLGFIISLAGYATTPAEELGADPAGPARVYGPAASEEQTREAAIAVQQLLPSVDGYGFVRVLSKSFDEGLPEVAARTLKGLAWWVAQPQSAGNARDPENAPAEPAQSAYHNPPAEQE